MEIIPAVILAGGQAVRMGGGDKALLPLGARTVLDHVIDRLAGQAAPLAINANGDPSRLARFRLPVLPDTVSGFPGPLAGILAGMDWAAALGAQQVVSVAADTPFFPVRLVLQLKAAAGASGLALAASHGSDGGAKVQPTFGIWPVALREVLRTDLQSGQRKVRLWAEGNHAGIAMFDTADEYDFFNINTPRDLGQAEAILTRRAGNGGPDV